MKRFLEALLITLSFLIAFVLFIPFIIAFPFIAVFSAIFRLFEGIYKDDNLYYSDRF